MQGADGPRLSTSKLTRLAEAAGLDGTLAGLQVIALVASGVHHGIDFILIKNS